MLRFQLKLVQKNLTDSERRVVEQKHLLETRAVALAEKARMIQERDEKCEKLRNELLALKKDIQVSHQT